MASSFASARMSGAARRGRLLGLAGALRSAMRPGAPSLLTRASAVPRMLRAGLTGDYPGARGRMLLMLLGIVYVVSPLDLVPEALFGLFGLADDAVIITWLATALLGSTDDFLAWESAGDHAAGSGQHAGQHAGAHAGRAHGWGSPADEPVQEWVQVPRH